tara:strand:+ start:2914 stop:3069 length:156 start_codon:yes stop_codon:yes gene_type:complete
MDYAIEVLQKDYDLIQKALVSTEAWKNYPEEYKRQQKKAKQLFNAIELLKQ